MQYLSLSKLDSEYVKDISLSRHEPVWLQEYRKTSIDEYKKSPHETSPLYHKYTDANKMNQDVICLSSESSTDVPLLIQNRIGELDNDELNVIQIGSNIHKISIPEELRSTGIIISSIHDAIQNNESVVHKSFQNIKSKIQDKYTCIFDFMF